MRSLCSRRWGPYRAHTTADNNVDDLHNPYFCATDGGGWRRPATVAFASAGVVFGYEQIDAMLVGSLFERLGYNFERRVRNFERLTRLNVRIAIVADKVPWSNPIRERRKKMGAVARERIAMLDKIAAGLQIPLTYTHHDRSTSGEGFTG